MHGQLAPPYFTVSPYEGMTVPQTVRLRREIAPACVLSLPAMLCEPSLRTPACAELTHCNVIADQKHIVRYCESTDLLRSTNEFVSRNKKRKRV